MIRSNTKLHPPSQTTRIQPDQHSQSPQHSSSISRNSAIVKQSHNRSSSLHYSIPQHPFTCRQTPSYGDSVFNTSQRDEDTRYSDTLPKNLNPLPSNVYPQDLNQSTHQQVLQSGDSFTNWVSNDVSFSKRVPASTNAPMLSTFSHKPTFPNQPASNGSHSIDFSRLHHFIHSASQMPSNDLHVEITNNVTEPFDYSQTVHVPYEEKSVQIEHSREVQSFHKLCCAAPGSRNPSNIGGNSMSMGQHNKQNPEYQGLFYSTSAEDESAEMSSRIPSQLIDEEENDNVKMFITNMSRCKGREADNPIHRDGLDQGMIRETISYGKSVSAFQEISVLSTSLNLSPLTAAMLDKKAKQFYPSSAFLYDNHMLNPTHKNGLFIEQYWCGNPSVELIEGSVYFYSSEQTFTRLQTLQKLQGDYITRDKATINLEADISDVERSYAEPSQRYIGVRPTFSSVEDLKADIVVLIVPQIPTNLAPAEFVQFIDRCGSVSGSGALDLVKVLHGASPDSYPCLLFCKVDMAFSLFQQINGRPYNPLESVECWAYLVEGLTAKVSGNRPSSKSDTLSKARRSSEHRMRCLRKMTQKSRFQHKPTGKGFSDCKYCSDRSDMDEDIPVKRKRSTFSLTTGKDDIKSNDLASVNYNKVKASHSEVTSSRYEEIEKEPITRRICSNDNCARLCDSDGEKDSRTNFEEARNSEAAYPILTPLERFEAMLSHLLLSPLHLSSSSTTSGSTSPGQQNASCAECSCGDMRNKNIFCECCCHADNRHARKPTKYAQSDPGECLQEENLRRRSLLDYESPISYSDELSPQLSSWQLDEAVMSKNEPSLKSSMDMHLRSAKPASQHLTSVHRETHSASDVYADNNERSFICNKEAVTTDTFSWVEQALDIATHSNQSPTFPMTDRTPSSSELCAGGSTTVPTLSKISANFTLKGRLPKSIPEVLSNTDLPSTAVPLGSTSIVPSAVLGTNRNQMSEESNASGERYSKSLRLLCPTFLVRRYEFPEFCAVCLEKVTWKSGTATTEPLSSTPPAVPTTPMTSPVGHATSFTSGTSIVAPSSCIVSVNPLASPVLSLASPTVTLNGHNDEPQLGVPINILCGHSFHSECLLRWWDATCPVCRHHQYPNKASCCDICGATERIMLCLVCGFLGCTESNMERTNSERCEAHSNCIEKDIRNDESINTAKGNAGAIPTGGHSYQHFVDTQHVYALELSTQRVWDFLRHSHVYRLLQNRDDGKVIEMGNQYAGSDHQHRSRSDEERRNDSRHLHLHHSCDNSDVDSCSTNSDGQGENKGPFDIILSSFHELLQAQLDDQRRYFEAQEFSLIRGFEEIEQQTVKRNIELQYQHIKAKKEWEEAANELETLLTREGQLKENIQQAEIHIGKLENLRKRLVQKKTANSESVAILLGKYKREEEEKLKKIENLETQVTDYKFHLRTIRELGSDLHPSSFLIGTRSNRRGRRGGTRRR